MWKLCLHLGLSTSGYLCNDLTRDVVQEFDRLSDEEEDVTESHPRDRDERSWGKVKDGCGTFTAVA